MNKNNVGVSLSILALVIVGLVYFQPVQPVQVQVVPVNTQQGNVVGSAGNVFTQPQYFLGGFATAGGTTNYDYATTTAWDSGAIAVDATSSAAFILRPVGQLGKLPAVGDVCRVGNPSASSTQLEIYQYKITAVDTSSGFKNASGSLLYWNRGPALDYGVANLNVSCVNVSSS